MDIIETVALRFKSGNDVPVTRAHITADEFSQLIAERDHYHDLFKAAVKDVAAAGAERDALAAELKALREASVAGKYMCKTHGHYIGRRYNCQECKPYTPIPASQGVTQPLLTYPSWKPEKHIDNFLAAKGGAK